MVIIFIRKLLDLFFTRNELKLLDDVMPEHTKRKREEEKLEKAAEEVKQGGQLIPNASSGNVAIPLANGNILKIPVDKFNAEQDKPCSINITEQLAKSGAWKSIDQSIQKIVDKTSQKSNNGCVRTGWVPGANFRFSLRNGKKRGNKKDAKTDEEQKRLSTMREEDDEEDCGITIRVDAPTPVPSTVTSNHNSPKDERNETSV